MKLLTRDEFRESVFARDDHKCVVCGEPAKDAHHIIERRLWDDGGYYIDNGASLCEKHHIEAETTDLCCDYIRECANIEKVVLPEDYYPDHIYTKWGDIVLQSGQRMPGPLFNDESVQKILKQGNSLSLYTRYIKYPRTKHLPWSEGMTSDDKVFDDCSVFEGKEVIVTEKMDGENTTIYPDYIHARSIDGRNHWSRSWVKNLHAKIAKDIPEGFRICGENLYAKHSLEYKNLRSFFYCFSIWDERNVCLSYDDTKQWCDMIGLEMPDVLYRGIWDEEKIKSLYTPEDRENKEGYVVRLSDEFPYSKFSKSIAKFVRKEHVGTSHHWFFTATEINELGK